MSTELQTQNEEHKTVFVDLDGYDRIRAHSPEHVNQRIQKEIEDRVRELGTKDWNALSRRINELDREWDVDRAMMAVFATLASGALILGLTKSKKWFALHAIQFPFLMVHAVAGWCPPTSVLRRMGFRSTKEIDAEKYALKTLRGDFVPKQLPTVVDEVGAMRRQLGFDRL